MTAPRDRSVKGSEVFVCHAHQDFSIALAVCAKLEAANVKCWIAPRDVGPGPYAKQLVQAIAGARAVVLIFSESANRSEHVLRELEIATNRQKILIPVRIQNVEPNEDLEYFTRRLQWLDASLPPLETRLDELVRFVQCIPKTQPVPGSTDDGKLSKPDVVEPVVIRLPAQLTSFVGRDDAIARIKMLLNAGRLVTLTGVGGAGKSRLSIRFAEELAERYRDGVWFVELAPLAQPDSIAQTIATTLGIREEANQSILATVQAVLAAKNALIVLDNCEHLVDACARIADALVRGCPHLTIIATSREPLQIPGETVYRVPPLANVDHNTLPSLDELKNIESVRLFLDRASTARQGFALTATNAPAIAQVCAKVDGIPLAIELAAARVKVLAPSQIADRLNDCFKLLTGGNRAAVPRQQTLRALVDWSYELLNEAERTLFRRLSVFAGGCTLEAAESICEDDLLPSIEVFDHLSSLVEKSLVIAEEANQRVRYRMLETLRQYGREKCTETEVRMTPLRHAEYFLNFLGQCDATEFYASKIDELDRLYAEYDNFRGAMAWSSSSPSREHRSAGACIAIHLHDFWFVRGEGDEGLRWLAAARSEDLTAVDGHEIKWMGQAVPATAECIRSLGMVRSAHIAWVKADYRAAQAYLAAADAIDATARFAMLLGWRKTLGALYAILTGDIQPVQALLTDAGELLGPAASSGLVALCWGHLAFAQGHPENTIDHYNKAVQIFRERGDQRFKAVALFFLGRAHVALTHYEQSQGLLSEALPVFYAIGEKRHEALVRGLLGIVALRRGDRGLAIEHLVVSLRISAKVGDRRGICESLEAFVDVAMDGPTDAARACLLLAAAVRLRDSIDAALNVGERKQFEYLRSRIRQALKEDDFHAVWQAGTNLSTEEAIDVALAPQ